MVSFFLFSEILFAILRHFLYACREGGFCVYSEMLRLNNLIAHYVSPVPSDNFLIHRHLFRFFCFLRGDI